MGGYGDPITFTLGTSERRAIRIFENGARRTDLSGVTRWTATLAGSTIDSATNPECFDWTTYHDLDTTSDILVMTLETVDIPKGPTSLVLCYYDGDHPNGKQLDNVLPALVQGEATGAAPASADGLTLLRSDLASTTVGKGADLVNGVTQVVRITDYGAVGDDSTDNSTALANAFAAANSSGRPIYIPPGIYRYSTALAIPASSKCRLIYGTGRASETSGALAPQCALYYTGAGVALTIGEAYAGGAGTPIFGFKIRDLQIIATSAATGILKIDYAPNWQLESVYAHGATGVSQPTSYGIWINQSAYSGKAMNSVASQITGSGWKIGYANNLSFVGCNSGTVSNCYEIGDAAGVPNNISFVNCAAQNAIDSTAADGTTGNGFWIRAGQHITIQGAYTDGAGCQFADVHCKGDLGSVNSVIYANPTVKYASASINLYGVTNFTMIGGAVRNVTLRDHATAVKEVTFVNVDETSYTPTVTDPRYIIVRLGNTIMAPTLLARGSASTTPSVLFSPSGATTSTVGIYAGANSPEGAITAGIGSIFLRTNGSAGMTVYVKESGVGNTGWRAFGQAAADANDTITPSAGYVQAEIVSIVTELHDLKDKLRTAGLIAP